MVTPAQRPEASLSQMAILRESGIKSPVSQKLSVVTSQGDGGLPQAMSRKKMSKVAGAENGEEETIRDANATDASQESSVDQCHIGSDSESSPHVSSIKPQDICPSEHSSIQKLVQDEFQYLDELDEVNVPYVNKQKKNGLQKAGAGLGKETKLSIIETDDVDAIQIDTCDMVSWPDAPLEFTFESLDSGDINGIDAGAAMYVQEMHQASGISEKSGDASGTAESSVKDGSHDDGNTSAKSGKPSSGKRKMKVDWTPDLHRRFVQAVEQLGVEKAIPSRILELMGVKSLTRHNVASHLQKYRSHRRHLAAREAEAASWHHRKVGEPVVWPMPKLQAWAYSSQPLGISSAYPAAPIQAQRAVVGVPPPHPFYQMTPYMGHPVAPPHPPRASLPQGGLSSQNSQAMGMPLHVWGHPAMEQSHAHMWQQAPPPMYAPHPGWYNTDGSMWQYSAPPAPLDMWGHPVMPVAGTPCFGPPVPPAAKMCNQSLEVTTSANNTSAELSEVLDDEANFGDIFFDETLPSIFPLSDDISEGFPTASGSTTDCTYEANNVLDAAISEALANPSTPLPLGLKPPSMDGVLAELDKQGIVMPNLLASPTLASTS